MQSRNNIFIPNSGVSCNRGTVEYRKGDQLERERLRVGVVVAGTGTWVCYRPEEVELVLRQSGKYINQQK